MAWTVVLAACLLTSIVIWRHAETLDSMRESFREAEDLEARRVAEHIGDHMMDTYQGLRTIARMPSIRNYRASGRISPESAESIQEIYNNLFLDVSLSEVYVVPASFDPANINPATGKTREPLLQFDQLILGRHLDQKQNESAEASNTVPEVEIHEYRLLRKQLDMLAKLYARDATIHGLSYPAVIGEEVITCDNSGFSVREPDDRDRMGIVYSVPYYNKQGRMKGVVSGILLTSRIRKWLPSENYQITATNYELSIGKHNSHSDDQRYIFSRSYSIPVVDVGSPWKLQVRVPEARFLESQRVAIQYRTTFLIIVLIWVACVSFVYIIRTQAQQKKLISMQNTELESRVKERTRELVRANRELELANEMNSQFLSRVSHELRTPLNAILGFSDLISDEAQSSNLEQIEDDCRRISDAAQRLLAVINDVLEISRIEAGQLEVSLERMSLDSLMAVIASNARAHVEKGNNEFSIDMGSVGGEIVSDERYITEVLMNVIGNAAKYTRDGQITLSLHAQQCVTDAGESYECIRFDVADTGIGIPEEKLQDIFEDFIRAGDEVVGEYRGTGLGLSIARRLCQMLGGSIRVASAPGQGSTFSIVLPREVRHIAS